VAGDQVADQRPVRGGRRGRACRPGR
jgi:hypothetical protein